MSWKQTGFPNEMPTLTCSICVKVITRNPVKFLSSLSFPQHWFLLLCLGLLCTWATKGVQTVMLSPGRATRPGDHGARPCSVAGLKNLPSHPFCWFVFLKGEKGHQDWAGKAYVHAYIYMRGCKSAQWDSSFYPNGPQLMPLSFRREKTLSGSGKSSRQWKK